MPIIIATCPQCGERIEIDMDRAVVVLSDNDAAVWRHIRGNHRAGERINVQVVADMAQVSHVTVYNILKRLVFLGLVKRTRVRRYHHYRVAPHTTTNPQKLKRTA